MPSLAAVLSTCLSIDLDGVFTNPLSDFSARRLKETLLKKFQDNVSPEADRKAIEKFLTSNEKCRNWERNFHSWEDELFGTFKRVIEEFWYLDGTTPLVSDIEDFSSLCRTGPGAAVGAAGYSFYEKLYSGPLTTTRPILAAWYRRMNRRSPDARNAERIRERRFGSISVLEGSRVTTVPKTTDVSRTICVEPSLNIYFQLGFGRRLEERLDKYFGISLATQPDRNRDLARVGSLENLGGFTPVTIDLESASDTISLKMLEAALPRDFVAWLKLLRSPKALVKGESVELHMVSSMGNGFTFPLETMLFAGVVRACLRVRNVRESECSDLVGVFGDDIIVPKLILRDVLCLLRILGFSVNTSKSFFEGPFRESCGYDFLNGHYVRGVYIKTLKTPQDHAVAINQINSWSAVTGIFLPLTVQYLLSRCRQYFVPPTLGMDAGVHVPRSYVSPRKSLRYQSDLVRHWSARPYSVSVVGRLIAFRHRKHAQANPYGLLRAFLRGDVCDGRLSLRARVVRYSTRWSVVPSWDFIPPEHLVMRFSNWRRWETAVDVNLNS